ncbi:MAG: hypothetical protein BWY36_00440 [Candidatus Diapherotrites archaeon ADurb.Bin253]|jgi:hypothetical protein|nr:MAG: hypothetical protein BWY36_00440 [Candidatus Diapherotrites archaeon ADurb.Bin253]HNZ52064.1 hypothetical protein [Candidatus Pacearchaeota archaeon]HPX74601.1 hypothetical protein [Candidatus Pacearchaeota archaeon]
MKLIVLPNNSFNESKKEDLNKIIFFAEKLLEKNDIPLPEKIYFYNSFEEFIEKVIPEVIGYGFSKEISKEIIKCALNNGTYGTLNYQENSIIEMNFNPFNKGEYSADDFLELLIHESLHLQLSNHMNKDINSIKFKFSKGKFLGNPRIIQLDEGYAEFMTKKILEDPEFYEINKIIKEIKIPFHNLESPSYKKNIDYLDINEFDSAFETLLLSNRDKGFKLFRSVFKEKKGYTSKQILDFAAKELKEII